MSRELEKQLEKDLKRRRESDEKSLPSWARGKEEKVKEKGGKKKKKKESR